MKLGQKITNLRLLEGMARGLNRELTQTEVSRGIEKELDGKISQSYLSQLESGTRPHLTGTTRLLLARFFKVHPGYLVDDAEEHLPAKPRRDLDDKLDLWLIDGAEEFAGDDRDLGEALLRIAKHEKSRDCLVLLGSLVENKVLIERLVGHLLPQPQPTRKRKSRV
ncbi:MAG TPA: helix-turn-helix transcriptional regulator [Thermoanaerobaculia bacterium]|nr:helix-turn-helix transcriptional regulator [Thermoanaerobaculia bacterium]